MKNVANRISNHSWDKVWDKLYDIIGDQNYCHVYNETLHQVDNQIYNTLVTQTWNQVRDNIK